MRLLQAYILVNTKPNMLWKVSEAALKIEGVEMAHAVTGEYDVIIYTKFPSMKDLRKLIEKIQSIDGVIRTQTAMVIPLRLEE